MMSDKGMSEDDQEKVGIDEDGISLRSLETQAD
jgi:hypothetical protein